MTTLATMRSNVSFGLGAKGGINSQIDNALNEATLQHVLTVKPKEMQATETFSTSSATAAYNLATATGSTDIYAILYVRNTTDDLPLILGDETEWNNSRQDSSVSSNLGRPNKWIHIEDDIVLYSMIPDSTTRTISLRYLKRPPTMTSAVAFPLNEEHERPVEQLAKALLWIDLGNDAKATAAKALYDQMISVRMEPVGVEDEQSMFHLQPLDNLYD